MLRYSQSTGVLTDAQGNVIARGYSGHDEGVNNPAMQDIPDVGPIPQGLWSIGAPRDDAEVGEFAMPLIPHSDTATFGRSGFYCHGDEVAHVGERLASHGCIVLDRPAREALWRGGDHVLEVTP